MAKEKQYIYTWPDRLWHWIHALSILMLAITGFVLHFGSGDLKTLRFWHNLFGFVVAFDYLFWLVHMLIYGNIRHYVKGNSWQGILQQVRYYTLGIFRGEPNPFHPTPKKRLNPLQALAYLGLMFVLVPLQGITGLLMWKTPAAWDHLLPLLAEIHFFVAYLIVAFLVGHLYLATTGVTVFADYKAMITGWIEE